MLYNVMKFLTRRLLSRVLRSSCERKAYRRQSHLLLHCEHLEPRMMLSADLPGITVGRVLSSYTTGGIQNNQVQLTYTVYNDQGDDVTGVLLTDTLQSGVTFQNATLLPEQDLAVLPDQSGQNLAWSLGTIPAFSRVSVSFTVSLSNSVPLQLDSGATAFGTLDGGSTTDSAPAATLRAGTVDSSLLASTPDANTSDPYVQEQAAKLDYDPQRIFDFLQADIGYNSYIGSVRGARGTLWSSAGNSLDVASLGVALMRASGIPAQYANGTLPDGLAQQLIVSMFPDASQLVGIITPVQTLSDPANSAELLSETKDHYWLQFDTGNGLKNADPLIAGATLNQSFTQATTHFAEVPDALREKTEVTLSAEMYSQASALFGLANNGLSQTPVLTQTFNDVDLVGHPLTIGNFVSQKSTGAVTFAVKTNTYSPYFALGDVAYDSKYDQIIRGQDYQEVLTTFPLSTQVLTGLFLDVTQSGPAGDPQTYSRALFDRIGYAARQGLVGTTVSIDPNGSPAISNYDVFTFNILASSNSPTPLGMLSAQVQQEVAALPAQQASDDSVVASEPVVRDLEIATTRLIANQYLSQSDAHTQQTATAAGVIAYYDRPRIVLASSRLTTDPVTQANGLSLSIDLLRESMRAIAVPGQPAMATTFFNTVRGIYNNITERNVIADLAPAGQSPQMQNTSDVFEAAAAQGIGFTEITSDSLLQLDSLNISAEARARIATDVQNGYAVIVPTQNVLLNGVETISWAEIDTQTGEFIGVNQDGGHEGLFEFFALAEENFEVQKELAKDLGGILEGFFAGAVLGLKYQVLNGISGDPELASAILDQDKDDAEKFAKKLAESGEIKLVLVSSPVLEVAFDIQEKGVKATLNKAIDDEIKEDYKIDFEWAVENTIYGLTGQDPPISPFLSNLQPPSFLPTNLDDAFIASPATSASGAIAGAVQIPSLSIQGPLSASWTSSDISSLDVASLTAASASVTDVNGNAIGTGTVALELDTTLMAAVSGNNQYNVTGTGTLAFYGAAGSNLGVSGNWTNYSATISATTGLVSVKLTTAGLKLNGQTLPAGTYTITASIATLLGRGASTSPSFSGFATLIATSATLVIGGASGSLAVGGQAMSIANGLTLANYAGSISVTAGNANLDSATFNGTATNALSVSAAPATVSTNQNTAVTFQVNLATSLADTYDVKVQGPAGWTISVDTTGKVTAKPAPGLQSGTFPIHVVVRSTTNPDLVAQCDVNVTVTPTQPGVTLNVTPDTMYTVLFHGAEIPTAYQASIHNTGPTAETFNLTFPILPTGFTVETSVDSVTIPAGQTGIVGVYLQPTNSLLAPGVPISFSVTATGSVDSSITATQTVTFNMPTIHNVTITDDPTAVSTIPNAAVSTVLTITNTGNVPEQITFTSVLASGLAVTNTPTTINLAPGNTTQVVPSLKPAAGTPLNSTLTATFDLTYGAAGSPITQSIDVPVHVVVPGAQAIQRAATSATQIGNDDLADRLNELTIALGGYVSEPTNAIDLSQALAAIDAIIEILSADPFLVTLVKNFNIARNELAAATLPANLQTAVNDLGNSLSNLALYLGDEAAHGFRLALEPASGVALPGVATVYGIALQNIGSQATQYNLSIPQGLAAGITGVFKQHGLSITSVTLEPGQLLLGGTDGITLELTQTTASLIPTTFTIHVVANGLAEIALNTQGSLTVRNAFVGVTQVTSSPAFTSAGTPIDVSAQILNAVNAQQVAQAFFTVTDSNQNVIFTSQPVPLTLNVQASLSTLGLGSFSTTNLANGSYAINVTVTDTSGNPIAGGSGQGSVQIGLPLSASLTVSPFVLQPSSGSSTVTNTLSFQSQTSLPNPLTLAGQVQTTPTGTSVALAGTTAYVVGTNDIEVVDVTNPTSPQVLHTFGQTDIVNNGFTVIRTANIGGTNFLLVGTSVITNSLKFKLLVYSLADPQNPTLVSSTPFAYQVMTDMLVSGTSLIVPTSGYQFNNVGGGITNQYGTVLSIDISNPAAPTLKDLLFNDPNQPASQAGDTNQMGGAIVNNHIAYIANTTSVGAQTQIGTGQVLVVDDSDPSNLTVLLQIAIPQTIQAVNVAIQGNLALVVGTTGGWRTPQAVATAGLTGKMTFTLLDISDPANPQLIGSTLVTDVDFPAGAAVNKVAVLPIGGGRFAISDGLLKGNPVLLLADASNTSNLLVTADPVPALGSDMAVAGNLLYTTSSDGLLIYNIGATTGVPFTATVTIPTGTGVSLVPNSFNVPPSQIITGANSTTLIWNQTLAFGESAPTFTWQSTVAGLEAGAVLPVTQGGTVAFTSQGTSGTLNLAPTLVSGAQIVGLRPGTQTAAPGAATTYTVTLSNASGINATYGLALTGLPSTWVNLPSSVNVPAHGSTTVSLTITSDPFAALGDHAFTVQVNGPGGTKGVVYGQLTVVGAPPVVDTSSHGIVATMTPSSTTLGLEDTITYTLHLVNTGSALDTYDLLANGLPSGVVATFSQPSILVPPGLTNSRNVTVTLTSSSNVVPGTYPFTVQVHEDSPVHTAATTATATLVVAANGARVTLDPVSGAAPGDTIHMTVTNIGGVTDTFDLSLAGPASLLTTLGNTKITLAPGASQVVSIGISSADFIEAGPLQLTAIVASEGNPLIMQQVTTSIQIPAAPGVTASFTPAAKLIPIPGTTLFQLVVDNTGDTDDSYTATITGTTGPVTASLSDFNGAPTQTIPTFRLPGLFSSVLLLQTNLSAAGAGTVTVQIRSLSHPLMTVSATATVTANALPGPTNIGLSNNTLAENLPSGTAVGTFNTTDPDAGNTFTYALVSGAGSADNASFTLTPDGHLTTNVSFDYETKNALLIRVKTTDQGGQSLEKQFTVNVTNIDEPPEIVLTPGVQTLHVPVKKLALDPAAKIRDVDTPIINLANVTVQVKITQNAAKGDKVHLLKPKRGEDLAIKGKNILYKGTLIGVRVYGTKGGVPLTVNFNSAATQAGVEAVLDKIYYHTKGPVGSTRKLEYSLTGLANGQSSKTTKDVLLG
jgi:uncharacterized repeat protein (TIGR01451 family)